MAVPVVLTGTLRAVAQATLAAAPAAAFSSTESTAESNKKDAANAASFLFFFSSSVTNALAHRHRKTVEGGTGADGGTVHGMDAVAE
ncbi:hypothetical protein, partial [Stenotrophomonas maltophilia]|uniref:hypothetical protein n=1 Tax=Stenotrophomonas maltophilia TaxID=40324 RepID=UPI001955260A